MSTFVKVVVGMLLTLPLLAYAAGSLVASSAEAPEEPTPITVPADPRSAEDREERSSAPGERRGKDRPPREEPRRGSLDQDDDDPEVVLPEPDTIDDDDSDDSDSRSEDDD